MANIYEWDNREDFDLWHNEIMSRKGIPDEVTFAYTLPLEVNGKIIASVDDKDSDGLTVTDLRPPREELFLGIENNETPTE
jgi:hypothetical protein